MADELFRLAARLVLDPFGPEFLLTRSGNGGWSADGMSAGELGDTIGWRDLCIGHDREALASDPEHAAGAVELGVVKVRRTCAGFTVRPHRRKRPLAGSE